MLLPYVDEAAIYNAINFDHCLYPDIQFSSTPCNRTLGQFLCPTDPNGATIGGNYAASSSYLGCGGKPFLVVGDYGKGKVAVIAATPFGQPKPGQTPFWAWDGWYYLMRNVLKHLWQQ